MRRRTLSDPDQRCGRSCNTSPSLRLQRSLEATPWNRAVLAEWQERFGQDFALLTPHLKPTGERAGVFPCPNGGGDGYLCSWCATPSLHLDGVVVDGEAVHAVARVGQCVDVGLDLLEPTHVRL